MRILLDCRYQRGAGPNITSNYLLEELLRINTEHEFLILQHSEQDLPAAEGIKKIFVPTKKRWAEFLWVQTQLNRHMKRARIDLYHSLKHFGPLFTHIPVVLPVRAVSQFLEGMQELTLVDKIYWRHIGRFAWARAALIIAVSRVCRDVLVNNVGIAGEKIVIVHHGVHSRFQPLTDDAIPRGFLERLGLNTKFILCVGNPYPHKNYETAVRALHNLKQRRPDLASLKLAIVGDPTYITQTLRSLISGYSLDDEVVFTGFVAHRDLVFLYNSAEVLFFCSLYEAFPNPIVESMACGLPVIAANRGAVSEIVGQSAELVDDVEDADAFAKAAERIMDSPACRMALSAAALERAAEFRWNHTARTVLGLYDRFSGHGDVD